MPSVVISRTSLIATVILLTCTGSLLQAQDSAGGGSLLGDISGGAALIFHRPENPLVHPPGPSGRDHAGGGRISERRAATPGRVASREQEQIIGNGNAARSAATPRFSEAEQQYKLAASRDPDDARAFAGLGNVYVDQSRFEDAVYAYRQAIKIKPDYKDAYMPLGYSLIRLNHYPEAIETYKQTLQFDANNPEVYNNLGFALNHTEAYQESVEACQQALRFLGEAGQSYKQGFQNRREVLSSAYKNLGNAYNGLKQYNDAAEALKRAILIEPNNAAAHFNLGLALSNAGRYSEAIEAYKEVLKLRPSLAPAHFNLGLTYLAIQDRTAALAEYDALKTLDVNMARQLHSMIKQ